MGGCLLSQYYEEVLGCNVACGIAALRPLKYRRSTEPPPPAPSSGDGPQMAAAVVTSVPSDSHPGPPLRADMPPLLVYTCTTERESSVKAPTVTTALHAQF